MIRPLTCVCMLLAGGSGLYLYQSKHQAQMQDREIARTLKATDAARERIGVLRGEWALLNEPDRLAALSQAHLGLKTLTPGQFVTAAELGARLPPPAVPGAAPEPAGENLDAPAAAAPAAAALAAPPAVPPPASAAPAPSRTAIAAKQAPPTPGQLGASLPRPPLQVASALPVPAAPLPTPKPPPPRPLAPVVNVSASPIATPAAPAPRPAPAHAAHAASPAPSVAPPRPTAPTPDASPGDSAMRVAQHIPGPGVTAPAAATSGYGQPPAVSASVLGGTRPLLPPPVPYGSAMAASGASAR
jgi:hypothetical protein